MENKKVAVRNTANSRTTINVPNMRFNMIWERRDVIRQIELDVLRELAYDTGVWNMLKNGTLYIDDMDVKVELGLEEADSKEPVNIIVLTDKERQRYLTVAPLRDLKEKCAQLHAEEINQLVDYAIEHDCIDYDKCKFLKEISGRDIVKAIELKRAERE